jgi:serine/threonine-protein kinase
MTPERYARLCELFDRAQARPADQRAAFLAEVGAADPALAAELGAMLADDQKARGEQLLEGPCPVNAKALLPGEQPTVAAAPPTKSSPGAAELTLPVGRAPEPASGIQTVLRRRLRFISLVILAAYAFFTVPFAVGLALHYEVYSKYLLRGTPYLLTVTITILLTAALWTKRPLSLRQLRGIELALFGLVTAGPAWELYCDLFLFPQFSGMAEWAHVGDPGALRDSDTATVVGYFWWLHSSYSTLPFVILIVCYATLIPSGWRRCTAVVGTMALTPVVISGAASVVTPAGPAYFALQYVVPMAITLAIAVAIAAYGTHRIELLRREVAEARKLGQYQLLRRLGAGGMGEVYLAEHTLLKQPCALKLIRPEQAGDPATLRRFEREVQATARLKHWNTVQIFDYGHAADGTFYYVMEYLPGVTLEELVGRHGPLPAARAVHLLRQACLALREAHALGLVHRDIKPANVMLCERGGAHDVVKLLDFGLVKAVGLGGSEEKLTREGAIAGTPDYMSPEQAAGRDDLDARSDVYSLGAVAYFLLTGRPLFPHERVMETIAAHLHEPVRPLTDVRADVPADLQAAVLRCLEKDPAKRFADIGRLQEALDGCGCAGQWDEAMAARWWSAHAVGQAFQPDR